MQANIIFFAIGNREILKNYQILSFLDSNFEVFINQKNFL